MDSTKTKMAAPVTREMNIGVKSTPEQFDNFSREDSVPPKSGKCPKDKQKTEEKEETKIKQSFTEQNLDHDSVSSDNDDLVMSVDSIVESPASETNMCIDESVDEDDGGQEAMPTEDSISISHDDDEMTNPAMEVSNTELDSNAGNIPLVLDTGQKSLPMIPDILPNLPRIDETMKKVIQNVPVVDMPTRPPYKGVMVPCGKLKDYLDSLLTFNRKCMLRKGREVHKIYVDMVKGECFLDDQFSYTEFGKMVLQNGSIRAGRAKNAKQIVVARETLYCSGTASCKRACGGYGVCLPGCDKSKMRGHRCAYRIKLTQRLGYVNFWFVEELGSHDQFGGGKDNEFKTNTQQAISTPKQLEAYTSALDLSPKSNKNSPERVIKHSTKSSLMNGGQCSVSTNRNDVTSDVTPNYHYVLGLMPAASPSRESPSRSSPKSHDGHVIAGASQPHLPSAISLHKDSSITSVSAIASQPMMGLPVSSHIVTSTLPNLPVNVVSFMPELIGLGMNSLQAGLNPLLVNVKQEPTDPEGQGQTQGQTQGQGHMMIPMVMPGGSIQYSTSQLAKTHSPLFNNMVPIKTESLTNVKKEMDSTDSVKMENGQKTQCKQNTLGQVHSRIMERARSRKSAQIMRVPQKISPDRDTQSNSDQTFIKTEAGSAVNLSIPKSSQDLTLGASDEMLLAGIPSMERFQTLNKILQSEAFQAAKNQLDQKRLLTEKLENGDQNQESALNLTLNTLKQNGSEEFTVKTEHKVIELEKQSSYFRLMEEWKKQNNQSNEAVACYQNGHIEDSLDGTDTEELTDNEKELINRVRQLETHVKQLQNVIIKRDTGESGSSSRRKKAQRKFDFSKYSTRHVALKIMYLGCDYHGFAVQEDTDKTIEHVLFEALKKTQLIESRETSNYHRCGRTDKGVSAFGQVISIDLRSNIPKESDVKDNEGKSATDKTDDKSEIRYCKILNKVLPPEIRVLAWAPVESDFSARFSCKQRTYKYMFPKANLDIPAMTEAAQKLVGERDYRNLCKMDVANGVTNFTRKILSADIRMLDDDQSGYSMCELTIVGSSFLWHQIRCIVAVLFLIGQGNEKVEIMDELLDIEKNPKKPQYTMAHEVPLCLYDSEFGDNFEWIYEADWHEDNIKQLQTLWAEHTVKATMLKRMLEDLDKAKVETECDIAPWSDLSPPVHNQVDWLIPGNKSRVYKPLMDRPKCESLEERLETLSQTRPCFHYPTRKECDIAPWSDLSPPVHNQVDWLIPGNKSRVYKPLMDRPKCESLEERLESLAKKRKLDPSASSQVTEALVTVKE